jgi:hypothetical protein
MTKISLFTKDQVLLASQKVKIASGDINSVTLKVVFDEKWDAFTSRTASFDNSNYNEDIPDCLLVDNQCVVPWEALSVAGVLSIGIIGDAADGKRKTSTIIKLNILQGVKTGNTTVSPSLDLYQQFIDAMVNLCDPVTSKLRADFSALMAEHDAAFTQRMEELDTYMQGEVLWENNSPTEEYGSGQLYAIETSHYKRFEIGVYEDTNVEVVNWVTARPGETVRLYGKQVGGDAIQHSRLCTISENGIIFGAVGSEDDRKAIPFQIIGYKY